MIYTTRVKILEMPDHIFVSRTGLHATAYFCENDFDYAKTLKSAVDQLVGLESWYVPFKNF